MQKHMRLSSCHSIGKRCHERRPPLQYTDISSGAQTHRALSMAIFACLFPGRRRLVDQRSRELEQTTKSYWSFCTKNEPGTGQDQKNRRDDTEVSESKGSGLKSSGPTSGLFTDRLKAMSSFEIGSWIDFLRIYGEEGVLLRELIMLASALYSPVEEYTQISARDPSSRQNRDSIVMKSSDWTQVGRDRASIEANCSGLGPASPYWTPSGERGLANLPNTDGYFLALLNEASRPEELQAIEEKLVSSGAVTVRNRVQPERSTGQDWVTDSRSWCIKSDHTYNRAAYNKFDNMNTCRELSALYLRTPDKDVHLMAEHYREMIYYHAHVALEYVFRIVRDQEVIFHYMEDRFPVLALLEDLALLVFGHRCQRQDEEILKLVKHQMNIRMVRLGHGQIPEWPWTERCIMLQLIEFKVNASRHSGRQGSSRMQSLDNETVTWFSRAVDAGDVISRKAWGMIGYALVDLADSIETMQDKQSFNRVIRLTRDWCDKALVSRTPIEMAALCCVLVRLRAFDELERMPQENHLACGCYLARSGFLELAAYFILSGIHYCEQKVPGALIWRYHLELWTVRIRLGQWDQAENWLSATWKRLSTRSNNLPADGFDKWEQSGELGEFKLNLACLLSDCYAANGRFMGARDMILTALEDISLMRDVSIRSTRVALRSRLLNVQLELQDWFNAAATAINLCNELREYETCSLASQKVLWTIQEILICVDELVHEELYVKAHRVLENLGVVFHAKFRSFTGFLFDNLNTDIDRRRKEVKSMLDLEEFQPDDWSTRDLIIPLDGPIQRVVPSDEIEHQGSKTLPIIRKPGNEMDNEGHTFPASASRTEAVAIRELQTEALYLCNPSIKDALSMQTASTESFVSQAENT